MIMLTVAKKVLSDEARALCVMSEELDKELGIQFEKVVDAVLSLQGRTALTGMGKSGHIAKKISATLASTGTPSYFLHPAEAAHGDMGMLVSGDLIIALSKSGNTPELDNIICFANKHRMPLVAITQNPNSRLAQNSTCKLILPDMPEACPLGAAPTTSSTAMLALGDALALTVLDRRGFTGQDFNLYHPGGSLGKKFMCVHEIMHTDDKIPAVPKDMPMPDALLRMTGCAFGCLGISENNILTGVITDGDLRRNMNAKLLEKRTGDIMSPNPIVIASNTLVSSALRLMNEKQITSLFVVDGQKQVLGIVHIHDCLRNT